jgi:DNA excision repair protein ERCC-5
MEAEAQCAQLVSLGLVDGIVTDDSDTFLFGGTRIYKNMFNQSKYVECFLASDLEKEYALDRTKLIRFAHLLGSDYTEGIAGVGPVTALEIITEFSGLEEFRDWWTQVQMGVDIPDDPHQSFRKKFKKMASKLFLPPSFPDARIDEAYMNPQVDSDTSEFQWGVPDLNGLRSFLMATIGWSQERTDEVLVPVIRDMNKREQEGTQANITRFVGGALGAGAFAPRVRAQGKSRMDKALGRLRAEAESRRRGEEATERVQEETEEPKEALETTRPRRRGRKGRKDK